MPRAGSQPLEDAADHLGRRALARRVEDHGVERAGVEMRQGLLDRRADELQPLLGDLVQLPVELGVLHALAALLDRGDAVAARPRAAARRARCRCRGRARASPLSPGSASATSRTSVAAAATFVWKKEDGETRNAGPSDCSLTWPAPRHALRLAAHEVRPRPVVQVQHEALGLLGPGRDRCERRPQRRVVARRDEHRDGLATRPSWCARRRGAAAPTSAARRPATPAATSASRSAKAIRLARSEWTGHSATATTSFVPRAKWPIARPDGPAPKTNAAFWRKCHGMPSAPGGMPIVGSTRGASFAHRAAQRARRAPPPCAAAARDRRCAARRSRRTTPA